MITFDSRAFSVRAALLSCTILGATSAYAQDNPQTRVQEDDENVIIVTGTKEDVTVQESTESVEIFTDERFDQENLFNTADALARTPGVSIVGDNLNTINIRGISRNGTNGAGQGVAINVFQDGVPVDGNLLSSGGASTWDLQQIEVLRGSQSTVQGRNSIAGAVVLQSKKPTFFWEGVGRLRIAEFGATQIAGAISGPLIGDMLAFRASIDYSEASGFITDGINGERTDFRDNLTARGRLLFEPEFLAGLSALFTAEYQLRKNGLAQSVVSPRGDVEFDFDPRLTFPESLGTRRIEGQRYVADITQDFSDTVSLVLLGSYERTDISSGAAARDQSNPFVSLGTFTDGKREAYQGEARMEFDFGQLTGFVGGYYFESDTATTGNLNDEIRNLLPPVVRVDPVNSVINTSFTTFQKIENFAFFTNWRYELNDKWTLDAALRYDDETFELSQSDPQNQVLPADCVGTAPGVFFGLPTFADVTLPCSIGADALVPPVEPVQSTSLGVWLPSASVTYSLTDNASIFVGYRRGYRAGGTRLSTSLQQGAGIEVVRFDPEFLDTFEAGWRTQWLDRRLTVNGTIFYSEYEDQQVTFVNERGFGITDNVGQSTLYGLELTTAYEVTPELDLYGSFSLLHTNIDEFLFTPDDPDTPADETLDLAGNDLDRSPSFQATIGIDYQNDSRLFGGASLNYQSAQWSDIFNLGEEQIGFGLTERVEAAAVVNARIGYEFNRNVRVTLYVDNLFDEKSPENINIGAGDLASGDTDLSNNVFTYALRQPQTFGATLDLSF